MSGEAAVCDQWHRRHVLLLAAIGLLIGVLRAEASTDTDSLWQARYGVDVLTTHHLPEVDAYSWTATGSRWIPSSWLWNVVLGAAYQLFGILGIASLGIGIAVAVGLALAFAGRQYGAPPVPIALSYAAFGLIAVAASPRAQALSGIFVIILPALLRRALFVPGRAFIPRLAVIVAVQLLWINLHSLALLGPIILAMSGAGLIAERQGRAQWRRAATRLAFAVLLTTGVSLLTPYGAQSFTHAAEVRDSPVGLINEWQHAGFESPGQLISLVVATAGCALAARAARAGRFSSAAMLVVFAAATASAVRFTSFELVIAIPEFALLLSRLRVRPRIFKVSLAAVAASLCAVTVAHHGSFGRIDDASGSPRLIAELPPHCRLVNDYGLGGAVILLRPDVKVSIDGRNDMYGRARVLAAVGMLADPPGVMRRIDAAGVNCVLVPSGAPLVAALQREPGWRVTGRDAARTLLVRAPSMPTSER